MNLSAFRVVLIAAAILVAQWVAWVHSGHHLTPHAEEIACAVCDAGLDNATPLAAAVATAEVHARYESPLATPVLAPSISRRAPIRVRGPPRPV